MAHADELSMKLQIEKVTRFAESKGYTVNEVYCDNGENGLTLDRPAMNKLLSDIRGGDIKIVIAQDLARFARDIILGMTFLAEAHKLGVTVITEYDELTDNSALYSLLDLIMRSKNKNHIRA